MATAVTIPKLGLTMTEAKIVQWLQKDGQQVIEGSPLIVIMTAKVTHEIQAPVSGTLHIVAHADETRPVSEAIGFILAPGEPVPETAPTAPATGATTSAAAFGRCTCLTVDHWHNRLTSPDRSSGRFDGICRAVGPFSTGRCRLITDLQNTKMGRPKTGQ